MKNTVLIVEDDKSIRRVFGMVIKGRGYPVLEAQNGKQGYEFWKKDKEKIGYILTDKDMPEMSGLEMALEIRKEDKNLIIDVMTGDPIPKPEYINNLLEKPIDLRALEDRIDKVLKNENK